jgi:hypothetical protein
MVAWDIRIKIVEEQIRRETTTEPDQGTTKKTLEKDLFGPRTINGEVAHIFSRGVIEAIHESQRQENQEQIPEKEPIQCQSFSRFGWRGEKSQRV